jgi:Transcriptional regulator
MELRQIRQFVALADTLNFHRAAKRLNMSQPPLSISMQKLEQELEVRLFDRLTRGVALTDAGLAALPHARKILRDVELMRDAASATVNGMRGRLGVGFVGSAVHGLLPKVVSLFRAERPLVELRLREDTSLAILKDLESGELDIGVLRTPVYNIGEMDLEPLYREEMIVVLPPDHPLRDRKTIRLEEIPDETFIGYDRSRLPSYHALTLAACEAAGFQPRIVEEAAYVQTMIALVESGIGIALAPATSRIPGANRVSYARLTVQKAPILIGLALATRKGETRPAQEAFKAALREAVARMIKEDPTMSPAILPAR